MTQQGFGWTDPQQLASLLPLCSIVWGDRALSPFSPTDPTFMSLPEHKQFPIFDATITTNCGTTW